MNEKKSQNYPDLWCSNIFISFNPIKGGGSWADDILAISPQWKLGSLSYVHQPRGKNAHTCDALQKFRYESTKIDSKKVILFTFVNQVKILWVFWNGKFRFHLLYQPIDTPNFFSRVLNFFLGAKKGLPPKNFNFFCSSPLLIY